MVVSGVAYSRAVGAHISDCHWILKAVGTILCLQAPPRNVNVEQNQAKPPSILLRNQCQSRDALKNIKNISLKLHEQKTNRNKARWHTKNRRWFDAIGRCPTEGKHKRESVPCVPRHRLSSRATTTNANEAWPSTASGDAPRSNAHERATKINTYVMRCKESSKSINTY